MVPGRVDFTLQVRDLSSDSMEDFVEDVCSKFDLRHEIKHQSEPALCDPDIQKMIGDSARNFNLKSVVMTSLRHLMILRTSPSVQWV